MLLQGDLRGQQAPKTKSRGAGMPWKMHQKRAEPYGAPGPCQTWRAMAAHCTETGLDKPGRKSDGMDRGGRHAGPQGNLPDPGEQWGSHTAWQGHAATRHLQHAACVLSREHGRACKGCQGGGSGGMGKPRRNSKAHQAVKEGRGVRGRGRRAQGEGPEGAGRETGQRSPANAPSCPWGMPRGAGARDLSHHIPLA